VVADVIDDHEPFLAGRLPQPASELLEPENLRLGRPEHHDGVERWEIDALVEHIHGKHDVQLAGLELLERGCPRRRRATRMDGDCANPFLLEECGHEIRVSL
jgi:hypothetical protein